MKKIKINKYSMEGKYIESYSTITEASRKNNCNRAGITKSCNNLTYCGEYQYRYSGKDFKPNADILPYDPRAGKPYVPRARKTREFHEVNMYDLDGKYLKTYPSVAVMCKESGLNKTAVYHSIKNQYLIYNHQYRYASEEFPAGKDIAPVMKFKKTINLYDLTGKFIRLYEDVIGFCNEFDIDFEVVRNAKRNAAPFRIKDHKYLWVITCKSRPAGKDIKLKKKRTAHSGIHVYTKEGKYLNTYENATEALYAMQQYDVPDNADRGNITRACRDKGSAYSYLWRYAEEYEAGKDIEPQKYCSKVNIPVNTYTLEGKFIRQYTNIYKAIDETGYSRQCLLSACAMRTHFGKYENQLWRYASEEYPTGKNIEIPANVRFYGKRNKSQRKADNRKIKVNQYSCTGKYMATFDSMTKAGAAIGVRGGAAISAACNSDNAYAAGYFWRIVSDEYPVGLDLSMPESKAVNMYSMMNKYMSTFESVYDAAMSVGGNPLLILSACNSKGKIYGLKWRFKGEDFPAKKDLK